VERSAEPNLGPVAEARNPPIPILALAARVSAARVSAARVSADWAVPFLVVKALRERARRQPTPLANQIRLRPRIRPRPRRDHVAEIRVVEARLPGPIQQPIRLRVRIRPRPLPDHVAEIQVAKARLPGPIQRVRRHPARKIPLPPPPAVPIRAPPLEPSNRTRLPARRDLATRSPQQPVGTPTHYNIGGATWTVTTYSDGTYVSTLTDNETGEVIRTETGKTQEGSEPEIIKAESSDSSTTTNADAEVETDKADVDTTDVDEYTPGRDGEYIMPLAQRLKYMQSLMQALNDTKRTPGKGGTDSTPNPMNESIDTVPWNYKDSVVRPVDGTSSSGIIPAEAIQQIQDPIGMQGGVINPVKNKDQQ
jgi:hypothetical protein